MGCSCWIVYVPLVISLPCSQAALGGPARAEL